MLDSDSDAEHSRPSTPDAEEVSTYQTLMSSLFPPDSLPQPPPPLLAPPTEVPAQVQVQGQGRLSNQADNDNGDDFDDGLVDDGAGGKRTMTKAEKQNAKKKRRKERERIARAAAERDEAIRLDEERQRAREAAEKAALPSVVPFRLFSACPVKPISIIDAPEDYPFPINPRHCGLDQEETERVRRVAEDSAVEYADLFRPASASSTSSAPATTSSRRRNHRLLYPFEGITALNALPDMFIGVIPRRGSTQRPSQMITSLRSLPTDQAAKVSLPLPVKVDKRTLPVVALSEVKRTKRTKRPSTASASGPTINPEQSIQTTTTKEAEPRKKKKARTRRGISSSSTTTKLKTHTKAKTRARAGPSAHTARFWAPPVGIGGKARGYAWGYRDSMEGRREQGAWEGYVRSKDR
ncbi:hypothetical protein IAU59_006209 [Kwoniella sp. CBS 9459]